MAERIGRVFDGDAVVIVCEDLCGSLAWMHPEVHDLRCPMRRVGLIPLSAQALDLRRAGWGRYWRSLTLA